MNGVVEPDWQFPELNLSCQICGVVVAVCAVCEKPFTEHVRVRCCGDGGHAHEVCGLRRSGIAKK